LAAAFSPSSQLLATVSGDRTARLWRVPQDLAQNPAPVVLRGHDRPVFGVAFGAAADGRPLYLITAGNDNTIRRWTLPPETLLGLACAAAGRNLTQAEWEQYFAGQPYRKTCAGLPAHRSAVAALLDQAQSGNGEAATEYYAQAARWAAESADAYLNNLICWHGSLDGFAQAVLPACEQAVQLAPADGALRDTRGLARALAGDYPGAIEDFTYFVAWSQENGLYEAYGRRREAWLEELESGRNPFDAAVLESLRAE
jgi:tetratricopeptide (TPR) repeat protein